MSMNSEGTLVIKEQVTVGLSALPGELTLPDHAGGLSDQDATAPCSAVISSSTVSCLDVGIVPIEDQSDRRRGGQALESVL